MAVFKSGVHHHNHPEPTSLQTFDRTEQDGGIVRSHSWMVRGGGCPTGGDAEKSNSVLRKDCRGCGVKQVKPRAERENSAPLTRSKRLLQPDWTAVHSVVVGKRDSANTKAFEQVKRVRSAPEPHPLVTKWSASLTAWSFKVCHPEISRYSSNTAPQLVRL